MQNDPHRTVAEGMPEQSKSEHHGGALGGQCVDNPLAAPLVQPQADHTTVEPLGLQQWPVIQCSHGQSRGLELGLAAINVVSAAVGAEVAIGMFQDPAQTRLPITTCLIIWPCAFPSQFPQHSATSPLPHACCGVELYIG